MKTLYPGTIENLEYLLISPLVAGAPYDPMHLPGGPTDTVEFAFKPSGTMPTNGSVGPPVVPTDWQAGTLYHAAADVATTYRTSILYGGTLTLASGEYVVYRRITTADGQKPERVVGMINVK